MNKHWQVLAEKIDDMQPRERVLLFLSAVAVIFLLWDGLFFGPALKERNLLNSQVTGFHQQMDSLQQEEKVLLQTMTADPDARQKQAIEDLHHQLQLLDKELAMLSVGLVPAVELPQILRDLLQGTGGLTLLGMKTLPMEELKIKAPDNEARLNSGENQSAEAVATGVFKHTVVVTLEGGYFQVLNYLTALEKLPWRFYWESVSYKVERYPKGTIELRVYTLSSEQGLLGV